MLLAYLNKIYCLQLKRLLLKILSSTSFAIWRYSIREDIFVVNCKMCNSWSYLRQTFFLWVLRQGLGWCVVCFDKIYTIFLHANRHFLFQFVRLPEFIDVVFHRIFSAESISLDHECHLVLLYAVHFDVHSQGKCTSSWR